MVRFEGLSMKGGSLWLTGFGLFLCANFGPVHLTELLAPRMGKH